MKTRSSIILALVIVTLLALVSVLPALAANTWTVNDALVDDAGCVSPTFQCKTIGAAVTAAAAGDTINVLAGTYALSAAVDVNKAGITLDGAGAGATIVQVSGTGPRFIISAPGVTLQDFEIVKTDKTGEQNIIQLVDGNNVTIKNNTIHGQFVIGDPEVSRALIFNAGAFSGVNIEGNTIYALRQPAYISGTHTGTIQNNYVYGTKGWVLEGGNLTFTGNTWGTGANVNVYDVAILSLMPAPYYTDIVAMSNANNGAVIEDQRVSPRVLSVVYVDDSAAACSSDCGGQVYPFQTITPAVTRVVAGGTIKVAAGTYDEDVNLPKSLSLLGAGAGSTTIRGVIGGDNATVRVAASNVTIAGFTITRLGNNPTDWNNPGLNSAGIAVQGTGFTGMLVRENTLTGNRTAIDINNSSGHTIRNNIITDNRTGLVLRNQTDNLTVVENAITNNWTVGFVFLDGSGGTNSPVQTALNCTFSNNNISGNWYGQIVDRQTGGSLPLPGTNLKNFSGNWFGTTSPVVTTANSAEPGYPDPFPVAYGGTAVPPGGQPDIAGAASANIDFTPYLNSGTDTNVETTPGRGTYGFQGDFSNLWVTAAGGQTGATGRIQEGIDSVSGSTVNVAAGTYVEQVVVDNKAVTIDGQGPSTIIQAPATVPTCFVVDSSDRKPIVCARNGASLVLKDLTVDGAGKGNSNVRFFGVAFRNSGGEISNVTVKDVRDTPLSGVQHGVGVYSFNDDAVSRTIRLLNSTIVGFQKNATAFIAGDTTPLVLDIHGNTITGAGTTTVTAQNGVQIQGKLVTGSVIDNTITGIAYDGGGWVATGILDYYSSVNIQGNTLTGCHTCIYKIEGSGEISGNALTVIKASGYSWGIVATDPPGARPSPVVEEARVSGNKALVTPASPAATLAISVIDNVVTFSGADNTSSYGIEVDSGYSNDDIAFTATGNVVSGFAVGVEIYQCELSCTLTGHLTTASVTNNTLAGNTIGLRSNLSYLIVDGQRNYWGTVVASGVAAATSGNVDYQPWCNADFTNCSYYPAGTISMQTSGTPAEVGEIVTMNSVVTVDGVYGMQLRVAFDQTGLEFQATDSSHNNVSAAGWFWDLPAENFAVVSGGRRLSGTMQDPPHANPATLTGQSVATWKFKCLKAGTFNLTYDGTAGQGTYLATKDGFNIPAGLTGGSVTCVAATASVDGYIKLQGRLGTNPHPAAWHGAQVTLTCASSECATFGPYVMTTDDSGHYQWLKTATPGSGVVQGTYVATVQRRAYLGVTKVGTVVVGAGTNTVNIVGTAPTLLGGNVISDSIIDVLDISLIGGAFGNTVTADTGADVNGDSFVNIFDLVMAGGNYNKTASVWTP